VGPWKVTVDWGDNSAKTTFNASPGALSAAHTYANDRPAPHTVNVTVTDVTDPAGAASFSASVTNVAPVVTITAPTAGSAVFTGAAVTARASFTDPGASDTHTCAITWGDGTTTSGTSLESGGGGTCSGTKTYTAAGSYTVTVKVTDNAGTLGSASIVLAVVKPPPLVLSAGPGQSSTEGAATTFNLGSFSGGAGPYTVTVDWGDGGAKTTFAASPGALAAAHTYVNDGSTPYAVTVTVTDVMGASTAAGFGVSVANLPPTAQITNPLQGALFKTGATVSISATFSDPGRADTHTCTISWGDGTTSTGTIGESGGAGTCSGSKTFKNVGSYTITVTVKDSANAATSTSVSISVTKTGHAAVAFPASGRTISSALAPAVQTTISKRAPQRAGLTVRLSMLFELSRLLSRTAPLPLLRHERCRAPSRNCRRGPTLLHGAVFRAPRTR
jgi:hypothetical protein